MEELNKQHVQVPEMDLEKEGLETNDPYIYACIKRYMNSETMQAFPSIQTISQDSGFNKAVVLESIARLENAGYFKTVKEYGKSTVYVFNNYKYFQIFSYDFLDNTKLSPKGKAYLVASQEYILKFPNSGLGVIEFDSTRMAKALRMSLPTLRKREKELQEAGILSLVPSKQKELLCIDGKQIINTGLNLFYRVYNFEEFCNTLALKFQQTDNRLDEQDSKIEEVNTKIDKLEKYLLEVLEENKKLKEENQKLLGIKL